MNNNVLKYLFIALLPLGLIACDDDEDKNEAFTTVHTQLQKDAQEYLQGDWVATPIKQELELNGVKFLTQVVFADTISFGQIFIEPKVFHRNDYLKGEIYNFTAHGECTYKPETIGECQEYYYYISPEADTFVLYNKETEKMYQTYQISFESQIQFSLQNGIHPYVFNKK